MNDSGDMFFSIPNMEYFSKNGAPFSGIYSEHTYFLNKVNMIYLLNKSNYEVCAIKYFKNHSIFFHCKKNNNLNISTLSLKQYNLSNEYIFDKTNKYFSELVSNINNKIQNKKNIFIFGCHQNSQILLHFGLNSENIVCILDNDKNKQGKYFYGTNLLCKSPDIISNIEEPIVICHIGVYTKEVKIQLDKMNKKIIWY